MDVDDSRFVEVGNNYQVSHLLKFGLLLVSLLGKKWSTFGLLFENLWSPNVLGTLRYYQILAALCFNIKWASSWSLYRRRLLWDGCGMSVEVEVPKVFMESIIIKFIKCMLNFPSTARGMYTNSKNTNQDEKIITTQLNASTTHAI